MARRRDEILAQSETAVRAGADAGIILIAPIGEVVPALPARLGVVGDLVSFEAETRRLLRRGVIQARRHILLREREFAAAVEGRKLGAGLDGELVEGEMIGGERKRPAQFLPPCRLLLPRPGIDQVEGQARKNALRERDGGNGLIRRMLAAEKGQCGGVETLHADGHAVDPRRPVSRETPGLDTGGVGLQRDLDRFVRREKVGRIGDQGRDIVRVEQARRAAAEKDRGQAPWPDPRRLIRQLAAQGRDHARLRNAFAHMRIEIAIRAFGETERPVNVEGQGIHSAAHKASSRFLKKAAQKLSLCWAMGVVGDKAHGPA